jgi:hypothetical protein
MKPNKIIVKFEDVAEQVNGPVKRLVGFVLARNMLGVFDAADLDANPRSAKVGAVTQAIIESIETDPAIFPFKTKGILVGSSSFSTLQRHRYELRFIDPQLEGLLDGGHNMLAIGTHILSRVIDDPRVIKRIKLWDDFKEAWIANRPAIDAIRDELTFLVPVEVLVPTDADDEETVEAFKSSLLEICAARNNNAELTLETKANQRGYYDELKKALPAEIASRIEWKSNMAGGDIKVRDIIALSWIPLSKLPLPKGIKAPSPQHIYSSKGECAKLFDDLMGHVEVSKPTNGPIHELHNVAVHSAIKVLGDLPELYDWIYAEFPHAYNRAGGDFGRLGIVRFFEPSKKADKNHKYLRRQPETHFTEQPVKYSYADGLIMPLVWGLRALMDTSDGNVVWRLDPRAFLQQNFDAIARSYRLVLDMSRFDPQKIGKNDNSYAFAESEFEKALLKQDSIAA